MPIEILVEFSAKNKTPLEILNEIEKKLRELFNVTAIANYSIAQVLNNPVEIAEVTILAAQNDGTE